MATITYVGSPWTTIAGGKTQAVTPAVGDLLLIIAGNSGRTTAQLPTFSISVQGITFTRYTGANATYTKNTSADSGGIWIADSFCTVASASTVTMAQGSDSGGGFALWRVVGMFRAGTGAIRQAGAQNNAAAGTPSITMPSAILTGNPVFGWVHNGTNSTTTTAPPTSWTEHNDSGYNTPTNGRESVSRASGETLTTIAWTGASASAFGSIIVELDASDPGGPPDPDRTERAVYRQALAH